MEDNDATVVWNLDAVASLVVREGVQTGTSFPLIQDQILIGRGDDLDIVLQDPMTSRRHARVDFQDGQPGIEDLGSSNGTFVNNVQITDRQALNPGDKVLIGQTVLEFQTADEQAEAPADEPSPPADHTFIMKELPKGQDEIPSRHILTTASQANERAGHENLGFLSESHGIMPTQPPLLSLPAGYEAWDEMAENLPELYRTLQVRKALEAMPVLSAAEADLPDEYLLRASVIISMLAHSYYRVEADPPPNPMPDGVQKPWEEISQRLDTPAPHLSTVDNKEERIFYLTQVETLAQCTPVISALVRAQEAAYRDDVDALKRELNLITGGLQHVTYKSFMTINPNPHSGSHVDPVVWAKTVAPFAVPINEGTAGPSGTSAPIFHMLDTFFSRQSYGSRFGEEMLHLRFKIR
jgi:sulfite reductase (NADPH) flavoprotein alpha-component